MRCMKYIVTLMAGLVIGWLAAGLWTDIVNPDEPADWIARIDGEFITAEDFIHEMGRRGGNRPGQYQDMEQKEALLESMLFQRAVVLAARAEGLDSRPEIRRSLDQILVNHYFQNHLRPRQEALRVSDEAVREVFEAHADDYTIPARRRVAMIQVNVPEGATPELRQASRARIEEARSLATQLNGSVTHFGHLAVDYSEDTASRYRNGVIGWIGETAPERYRHDPVVVAAANAMHEAGTISEVLEGEGAYYIVRLVSLEPARTRSLEELADGIRQRLVQEHYRIEEQAFRAELLARFETEVRTRQLKGIEPLAGRATSEPPAPPALPLDQQGD
jgi:parvulin-like peptidyl-prolyl isomerase